MRTTERVSFIDPIDIPPPLGQKLLILTKYGICVVGMWKENDSLGWQWLPDVSPELKRKMMEFATGKNNNECR